MEDTIEFRTFWNTNDRVKPGDKYIQVSKKQSQGGYSVWVYNGEAVVGDFKKTESACKTFAAYQPADDEFKTQCRAALGQGYRLFDNIHHGSNRRE